MCFQHNKREIKKKFPSIIEEQVYVVQLNVVVIEPPSNQTSALEIYFSS